MSSKPEPEEGELRITSRSNDADLVFFDPVYMPVGGARLCGICQFKGSRGTLVVSTEVDKSGTTYFGGLQKLLQEVAGDLRSWSNKEWKSSEGEMSIPARHHEDRVFIIAEVRPDLKSWETVARIEVDVNHGSLAEISARAKELFGPRPK